jgi:hypothetical protein
MRRALWLAMCAASCSDDAGRPPPVGDGDADADTDADADADGDGDGDGDTDADTDADGDGDDPTACQGDGDCVVAVDLALCCACPRAVSTAFEAASECVAPWPHEGAVPDECARQCGECTSCGAPDEAVCLEGICTLRFPGECETSDDCAPGEQCVEVSGQTRCEAILGSCTDYTDCQIDEACTPGEDGVRFCGPLPPGACAWDGQCDTKDGHVCEGESADELGRCVPPG